MEFSPRINLPHMKIYTPFIRPCKVYFDFKNLIFASFDKDNNQTILLHGVVFIVQKLCQGQLIRIKMLLRQY